MKMKINATNYPKNLFKKRMTELTNKEITLANVGEMIHLYYLGYKKALTLFEIFHVINEEDDKKAESIRRCLQLLEACEKSLQVGQNEIAFACFTVFLTVTRVSQGYVDNDCLTIGAIMLFDGYCGYDYNEEQFLLHIFNILQLNLNGNVSHEVTELMEYEKRYISILKRYKRHK